MARGAAEAFAKSRARRLRPEGAWASDGSSRSVGVVARSLRCRVPPTDGKASAAAMTAAWPGSLARHKLRDLDQRVLFTCKDALVGFREAWCGSCGSLYGQDCQRRLAAPSWPTVWEALLRSRRIPDPMSQEVKEQEAICARVLELLSSTKTHYESGSPQLNAVVTEIVSASKAYWRKWLQQRLSEDAALWNNFALEKGYTREELASLARGGDDAVARPPTGNPVDTKPSIPVAVPAPRTKAPKAPAVAASVSTDKEPAQASNTTHAVSASPAHIEHAAPSAAPLLAHNEPSAPTAPAASPAPTVKSQRTKKKRVRLEDEAEPEPRPKPKKSPKHPPAAATPPAAPVGITVDEAGDGSLSLRVQPPAWWAAEHVARFVAALESVWLTHSTPPAPAAAAELAKAKVAKKRRLENDVAAVVKAARLPQRFVDLLRSEVRPRCVW